MKEEHPDNYDAELLLRLYDLRREAKLREGRDWFIREFNAKTLTTTLPRPPWARIRARYFRMTVTYWDMAASLVNRGLINVDLFFENTGEFWIVWDKVRNVAPTLREKNKNPIAWKNLETLAGKYEEWMAKRAPEALDSLRQRLAGSAAEETRASPEETALPV